MISQVGTGLVLASLLFATLGSVMGFVAGSRYSERAWQLTRTFALLFSGSMISANLLMVYALLTPDFTVKYVGQVGSTEAPTIIAIVSLWSSLEGSILFWGGVLSIYVIGMVVTLQQKAYREYAPWTLHVMLAIAVFFALLVASIADPFAYVSPETLKVDWASRGVSDTGPGPNPLLQNHWLMAVHPPMLYLGYVGMAAPFSLICASLLAGRLDAGWMAPIRRWMLVPWAFLTVGIVLGGWWSYAVLGWGGAWAWDPVENASFMPWLTGTAFIHSAMVLERRGKLRDWTLMLGLATFLLTMLGTFMTRSGVFNSVHSFTQSDIGPTFLFFIFITFVYSVVLLATRSHLLDRHAAVTEWGAQQGSAARSGTLAGGREIAILLQNALFSVFTLIVLLGTVFPLLVEQFQDRRISIGEPWFDRWSLPICLGLVFMMGVGPALPWGRIPPEEAAKRFIPPFISGLVFAGIVALLGMTSFLPLLTVFICGFAFYGNMQELVGPVLLRMRSKNENPITAATTVVKKTRRRFGGHIAHYGVILAAVALALSRGYREEEHFNMSARETIVFQGFSVTYAGYDVDDNTHRRSERGQFIVRTDGSTPSSAEVDATLAAWKTESQGLMRRGALGLLTSAVVDPLFPREVYEPSLNRYKGSRMPDPQWSPDVRSTPMSDLYFSLIELPSDGQTVQIKLIRRPFMSWLWWAAPVIFIGTLIAGWPSRRERQRVVQPAGQTA